MSSYCRWAGLKQGAPGGPGLRASPCSKGPARMPPALRPTQHGEKYNILLSPCPAVLGEVSSPNSFLLRVLLQSCDSETAFVFKSRTDK
jgi:hypothetical protein